MLIIRISVSLFGKFTVMSIPFVARAAGGRYGFWDRSHKIKFEKGSLVQTCLPAENVMQKPLYHFANKVVIHDLGDQNVDKLTFADIFGGREEDLAINVVGIRIGSAEEAL